MATSDFVTVRPTEAPDLDAVASLEAAVFAAPWTRERLAGELAGDAARSLVAVTPDGRVVAHCLAWLVLDEAEILTFATAPDARRRGLGGALLDAALARWRGEGVAAVHLEVRASNAPAIGLYASRGFRAVGRRPRYYSDGEDAVLMRAELA